MEIYKVKLSTTNALKNTTCDKYGRNYITVEDGYIFVTKKDIKYVTDNYKWLSIEIAGILFQTPTEECHVED